MRNRVLLPYLILLLGFCFTLLVYYYFYKLTYEQDRIRFNSSVQEIQDQMRLRIATSTALLRAGTGLFAASDFVDAHEFESFVTEIELDKNYPGVEGIGYSVRFAPADKAQVVAGMKRQGVAKFRIWPDDSPRPDMRWGATAIGTARSSPSAPTSSARTVSGCPTRATACPICSTT